MNQFSTMHSVGPRTQPLPVPIAYATIAPTLSVAQLTSENLAAATRTPLESLRTLLSEHFTRLYPTISVLGEASYARFADNFGIFVVDAFSRKLDKPKRYSASTLWSAPTDYGCVTVLLEGPPGVGKSSLLRLIARDQLTNVTIDDDAQRTCEWVGAAVRSQVGGAATNVSGEGRSTRAMSVSPSLTSMPPSKRNILDTPEAGIPSPAAATTPPPSESCLTMNSAAPGGIGRGYGRLVVLVELRHLALQTITHGWEKITPQRLLDVALRGLGGGSGGGISALETLGGLKAAILARPIVWLLDGFDEVCNIVCPAMQAFFRSFVFPDAESAARPKHAMHGETREDIVVVTCREDQAAVNHPVLSGRQPREILRLLITRWRIPETLAFVDDYFSRFRNAHPEWVPATNEVSFEDVVMSVLQEPTMNAWNGVPLMCDVLCFMATIDLQRLSTVVSPAEALQFALDALFKQNVPLALQRGPAIQRLDIGGALRNSVFQLARDRALRVFETGSNAVMLDLSTFNGAPTNTIEFVLSYTGWLHRRTDVADGGGSGDRHTCWYFAHRCFLEFLAATSLSNAEPQALEKWGKEHVRLDPGQRMMISLLCHEISCRHLTKHRDVLLAQIHRQFLKNYDEMRDHVREVLQKDPPFRVREKLWEASGALIAIESCVILHDDRIVVPPKHLGLVPHMKNPSYFYLLLEPIARFGSLSLLKKACAALEADGRFNERLASQALAQAMAHAPPGALMSFSVDGGGHRMVIDHLLACGGTVRIEHACECASLTAVQRALQGSLTTPELLTALETAIDHGFDLGVSEILNHCQKSVTIGIASSTLLCSALSLVIGRALVVGQLKCFYAAAETLGAQRYELTVSEAPRPPRVTTMHHDTRHSIITIDIVTSKLPHPFTDKQLARLLLACPNMHSFDVSGLTGAISDDGLCAVAEHCSELSVFNIASTRGCMSDVGVCAVFSNCTTLEYVNVAGTSGAVTDVALLALGMSCGKRLRHLDVSRISTDSLTDKGFIAFLRECAILRNISASDTALTDDTVKAIAVTSPLLQTLDVGGNKGNVTDGSIHLLAHHCVGLLSLDVSEAEGNVTNAAIHSIAQNCRSLKCLNVSGSNGAVTDDGIMMLASGCGQLESLDIVGARVTDASLHALAQGCRKLRSLHMTGCGAVTDVGLKSLATGCAKLESLYVDGTSHLITKVGAKAIATRCSNLVSLYIGGVTTK